MVAKSKKRIAYFGGSFDPPHLGHLAVAESVIKQGLADEVWMAPAWIPPHKARRLSSFEQRLAMVALAVAGVEEVKSCGVEGELQLNPSYSLSVLGELETMFPDCEFRLLIGGDMLSSLHTWHRASELVARYEIIVYPRRDEAVSCELLQEHWSKPIAEKLSSKVLHNLPFFDISSTNIREKLAKSENMDNIINRTVLDYIKEAGLYSAMEKNDE